MRRVASASLFPNETKARRFTTLYDAPRRSTTLAASPWEEVPREKNEKGERTHESRVYVRMVKFIGASRRSCGGGEGGHGDVTSPAEIPFLFHAVPWGRVPFAARIKRDPANLTPAVTNSDCLTKKRRHFHFVDLSLFDELDD